MLQQYQDWIKENVKDPLGTCAEHTQAMAQRFPELTRVRGHYLCLIWGKREHWWLVCQDGSIVDPTVAQFPSGRLGTYILWDENKKEPTGMCPNCAEYCYDGMSSCSTQCELQYTAYLNNPNRW
jgi:hypothetical protein